MAPNNRERTYEYTISFEPENFVKVPGGWFISGASVNLARKRQHRHEAPLPQKDASASRATSLLESIEKRTIKSKKQHHEF